MLDNKADNKHGSKLKRILHAKSHVPLLTNNKSQKGGKIQDLAISSPILQHSTNIYSLTSPTRASFEIKNNDTDNVTFYDLYQPISPPPPIPTSITSSTIDNNNDNKNHSYHSNLTHYQAIPSRNNPATRCDTNCLTVTPKPTRARRSGSFNNYQYNHTNNGPTLLAQHHNKNLVHPLDNIDDKNNTSSPYIKKSLDIPRRIKRDSKSSINSMNDHNEDDHNNINIRSSSLKNLNQKNLRRHSCTSTVYHQQQQIQLLQHRYQQHKTSSNTINNRSNPNLNTNSNNNTNNINANNNNNISSSSYSSSIQNASPAGVAAVAAIQSCKSSSKLFSKGYQEKKDQEKMAIHGSSAASLISSKSSSFNSSISTGSFILEKSKSTPLKSHSKIKTYNVQQSNNNNHKRHTSTSTPRRKHGSQGRLSIFQSSNNNKNSLHHKNPSLQLERDLEKKKRQQELEDLISGRRGSTLKLSLSGKNGLLN